MNKKIVSAAIAVVSFCALAQDWVYDSASGTVSDGVWTFKASVASKTTNITFDTCWGYPEELSTLDLSKPVTDGGSTTYTITTLGTMFGNVSNWGKDVYETTNGMTLAKLILPPTGLTKICAACFCNLPALTNIVNFLPDSVTSIGTSGPNGALGDTFYGVKAEQDLRLMGLVGGLARMEFQGSKITSVTFGPGLERIGPGSNTQGTFDSCGNITNWVFSPYGCNLAMSKCTMALKSGTMQVANLRGFRKFETGGAFSGFSFSKVIFDDVLDDMGDGDAFKNCNNINEVVFRGKPPSNLIIKYRSYSATIPTYIRKLYKDDWAQYAEGGEISETGTTFSEAYCTSVGTTPANRPLLLLPTVKIGTAADFVTELTANPEGEFELTSDIDLTGSGYTTLPEFLGCLDGNGYTITGLGAQALFENLAGTIANLTIDGNVGGNVTQFSFAGDAVEGVFCRRNYSGTIVDSCVKNYKLTGNGQGCDIGMFAGQAINDASFVRCSTDASSTWKANNSANSHMSYAGGIVGHVKQNASPYRTVDIICCTNNAIGGFNKECYSGGAVGGIVGYVNNISALCTISGCVNNGEISSTFKGSTMGGLLGAGGATAGNSGKMLVLDCANNGPVTASATNGGFFLGGLAGTSVACLVVSNFVNRGNIVCETGVSYSAGFCSNGSGEVPRDVKQYYFNCANYGNISAVTEAAGFNASSKSNKDYSGTEIDYVNCANYGTVTSVITDEFIPAGIESKSTMYYARSNRKVQNAFAPTQNIEYFKDPHAANKWWFTVSDTVTAADDGYDVDAAVVTLNAGAATLGFGEWCKGTVNGVVVPELKQFCLDPVVAHRGLMIIYR